MSVSVADPKKQVAALGAEGRNGIKPIWLYDNLSEVLFWHIGIFMAVLAIISIPNQVDLSALWIFQWVKDYDWFKAFDENSLISPPVVFWMAVVGWVFFFILYRYNLSRKNFLMVFGLVGTFIGIPATLELVGYGSVFRYLGNLLGGLTPAANAGAYCFMTILCFIPWVGNKFWSRANTRAKLDEAGLTVYFADGSSRNFDLIGLVTDETNFDYGEWLLSGNGRLKFKLKNGKILFQLDRVHGLFWTPLTFWREGLSKQISYALSFQGKVASVDVVTSEIHQMNDDLTDDFTEDHDSDDDSAGHSTGDKAFS